MGELQVNGRVLATGVVAAYVRLTSHQMERFKAMPVYFGAMPDVKGKRKAVSLEKKLHHSYCDFNRWTSAAYAR